ncbi:MAG TPA: EAL domain-containing protein [Gammaproteobacteria bacterium]
MVERNFLPLLIISQSQNNAEKINSILRGAGHAVRSSWVATLDEAESAIQAQKPALILCFLKVPEAPINDVIGLQQRLCPDAALIAVASKMDETAAAAVIERGARDLVSMESERRLAAVVSREAAHVETARELESTQVLVAEYQSRFQDLLAESGDAIAYVQDGILTQANPSFAEMFGFASADDIEGFPVMDLFASADQGKLKEALVSVNKGKKVGELAVKGVKDDKPFETRLEFDQTELDGEPCIEIAIRGEADNSELQAKMQAEMDEIGRRDPLTGLFNRHYFVDLVSHAVKQPPKPLAALLIIKPDKFADIEEKVGPLASDNVLRLLGAQLRDLAEENDQLARFGGNILTALIVRKDLREIEAFAEKLRTAIAGRVFEAGGQSTSMTASIGIADLTNTVKNAGALIALAQQAGKEARQKGGNKYAVYKPAEVDQEGRLLDIGWVKQITSALKDNRFQLVFQPIASLEGDVSEMFDILVRMKGEDGKEIMPGEFMPAAERNNLMGGIDRWIVNNAIGRLKERIAEGKKARFFIRLSEKTLADGQFIVWLDGQFKQHQPPKGGIVLQISEATAEKRLKEAKAVGDLSNQYGQGIALEHFGVGRNPMQMFDHIKMNFVKIDGSFMSVIATDEKKRELVKGFIDKAKEMKIETVAERVENANTMAVLWQLGVNYIQGNYVQEPEVVMAEDARLPA